MHIANISTLPTRKDGISTAGHNEPAVFLQFMGGFVRYPNLRYGNPTELAYYAAFWGSVPRLAKFLRRDERTVRDWISAKTRVPWWVPEILRLKRMEAELRHQQMGMGRLALALGGVSAEVISLTQANCKKALDDAPPPAVNHGTKSLRTGPSASPAIFLRRTARRLRRSQRIARHGRKRDVPA
jgi:hypothetical protein